MKTSVSENEFYGAYDRGGQGCVLKKKHIRQFDRDFVRSSGFVPSMSVLELGCGNGLFLRYLDHLGVSRFVGVDGDPRVMGEMPPDLASHVRIADFSAFFSGHSPGETFDRVAMFDVLEHFTAEDGADLLRGLAPLLAPGGRVVIRTPNMASPWGLGVQYNDVTHRTCYTPGSLSQVAKVAGFRLLAVHPQAYGSWGREFRERLLTGVMSSFLAAPPHIWTPNLIGVLERDGGG
ncbi:MAG: class I SAM-dependent methyltransferase [Alphaproteobacteria bacterium]|nr:class I SAM-dependent methyltransferase [Alphaproteobacteria bacterium]MBF0130277.1 class I SAM-dependent methyltransferase [Alphaproteobacteria bacterium]